MAAADRLAKARIKLQEKNPFFSKVSFWLVFKKENDIGSAGVDTEGNMYYNEEFVKSLTDDELQTLVAHEVCHPAFLHHQRLNGRNPERWNVATDCAANAILKSAGFNKIEGSLWTDDNDCIDFKFMGKTLFKIENVSKKLPEQIYNELPIIKGGGGRGRGGGKGNPCDENGQFDTHIYDGKGKQLTPQQKKAIEEEWKSRVADADAYARQKGRGVAGIEREIGKLHESKIRWQDYMDIEITNAIPSDYSFQRPNKRYLEYDVYLPSIAKEKIDVVAMIDLSGSIEPEQQNIFLSEIVGIAETYREKLSIRILTHDEEVHTDHLVENGNIDKIKEIKMKGGGGTSFRIPMDWINENIPDAKCIVWLTDGYGDKIPPDDVQGKKLIWVLSEKGDDSLIKDLGVVIRMEEQ